MEPKLIQYQSVIESKKSKNILVLFGLLYISLCLQGCPFAVSDNVDCGKYGYQGRVSVNYFAYFNGMQWENISIPDIKISYDFVDNRVLFADSVNNRFYYYNDYNSDYSVPRSFWSYSLDTRQWKLLISAHDMRYFTIKDAIIYFFDADSIFITDKGTVRGGGIMRFDGNILTELDPILGKSGITNMFVSGEYLYFRQTNNEQYQGLWRYSLLTKQREKVPISIFSPWTEYSPYMYYEGVGRYIYYNYSPPSSDAYRISRIYRYDASTGTSEEVVKNATIYMYSALSPFKSITEDYIIFKEATIGHKGKSYNGTVVYDISNDEFTSINVGNNNTDNLDYAIHLCSIGYRSVYVTGQFSYLNGIKAGNIGRYDIPERKTYALDGGVYRTDTGCNPVIIDGMASIGDKLIIYGNFQSAGIR